MADHTMELILAASEIRLAVIGTGNRNAADPVRKPAGNQQNTGDGQGQIDEEMAERELAYGPERPIVYHDFCAGHVQTRRRSRNSSRPICLFRTR
jgi:hypothetical protein